MVPWKAGKARLFGVVSLLKTAFKSALGGSAKVRFGIHGDKI
jgi:hypothetical protein